MDALLIFLGGAVVAFGLVWIRHSFADFPSQTPADFAGTGPEFNLREYLKGPILCEGVIYGPTGRISARFVADMDARWEGNTGIMTERFRYDTGTVRDREWRLTIGNDGAIKAEADDVIGTGEGQQIGAGIKLNYKIRLPEESGGHVLDTTDWMYLVENGTIINRSQFRKFGIKVAELVATMRRVDAH